MIECLRMFLRQLPSELLDLMCQNFIQNWIRIEERGGALDARSGICDANQFELTPTLNSDARSIENIR